VKVVKLQTYWACLGIVEQQNGTQVQQTLEQYIEALPIEHKWPFAQFQKNNIEAVIRSMQEGTAAVVSDGSFKQHKGASLWILEAKDVTGKVEGMNLVPGDEPIQSSYRSELAGLLGTILIANVMYELFKLVQASITIACNNDSALYMALQDEGQILVKTKDFDLLLSIRQAVKCTKINWNAVQVKGHQDGMKTFNELTRL